MNIELVQKSILFRGMTGEELTRALERLEATERGYRKGTVILHAGDNTRRMGLVTQGSVTIENNDIWGNRTILSHVGVGQFCAETYALLQDEPMHVDVVAAERCTILFLQIGSLQELLRYKEPWMTRFLANLLAISAHKNLTLSDRSRHTAPKTIRGRVMAYLNSVSLHEHAQEFDIPYDRQGLADYLNVERTALSKELGRMQDDGLIAVNKSHFTILE